MYDYLRQRIQGDASLMGLRLYVDRANAPARKVYETLGMDGEHYVTYEWLKNAHQQGRIL
jgi:hypothetical protein